ncbi:hypothetical protein [Persicobacter diffluens]|uniref:Uncharacterized protein n=1 Tax=Persicobacter diffluens TaxID=981 RepID=A0AAN5AMX6_9BACT|nr:hypothetical protein PEDI_54510 [Persicobacter diffluens]
MSTSSNTKIDQYLAEIRKNLSEESLRIVAEKSRKAGINKTIKTFQNLL